ncbi:integral membrane protein [Pholiota conissans]|uniref:Integral membrane protein n=1 Tax=Pholiota conissans TaxID=109636 RepID=A0A9P6CVQ1_9AGAR|nr:integral membrane protein [Pholiota conissans]
MVAFSALPAYLDWPAQFCALCSVATYIASILTSNVSHVDRLWTFLPTIYTAYFAFLPALPNAQSFLVAPYAPKALGWAALKDYSPRAVLMFSLIFVWMSRLSYNAYRRGLFNFHEEDYRWAVLRQEMPPWQFQVLNLTFIAVTQNVLLLLLGLPAYTASVLQPHTALGTSDYALAAVALSLLAIEATADNQQFAFHAWKHAYLAKEKAKENGGKAEAVKKYNAKEHWPGSRLAWTPADAKRGFVTRGLWRYSRHPNFACEQSFWWVITLFPLLAPDAPSLPALSSLPSLLSTPAALLPTLYYLCPALALSALFFSSTQFSEKISLSKYPEAYRAYQKSVGMFLPLGTLEKSVILKLTTGSEDRKKLYGLVWGNAVASDKKE